MISCDYCQKRIIPDEDYTLIIRTDGIITRLHLENCTRDWITENTVGGIIE